MKGLGDLEGGLVKSQANAVNSDGSVVVGYSESANGGEAFYWTQAGGMVSLGSLSGGMVVSGTLTRRNFQSKASAVNPDGSVVVGQSKSTSGLEAFVGHKQEEW